MQTVAANSEIAWQAGTPDNMMGIEVYDRDGSDLVDHGLFIDHGPWHFNVFELQAN